MATGGDRTVAQQLHDWSVNTMHFVPSGRHAGARMPTVEDFEIMCHGPMNDIWRYVIAHVRSAKTVKTVKGNLMLHEMHSKALQREMSDQSDGTDVDLVAKKHALTSQLLSTVSTSQVLQRDIKRLRKDLVTAELSYRSAINDINDLRRKKALLQAHSQQTQETVTRIDEFTKQIRLKLELLAELRRKSSQPPVMVSRCSQSADSETTANLETVSMKTIRETCEAITVFFEQLYLGSFEGNEQAISRSKEDLWRKVEAALSEVSATELLAALCAHADETSAALAQKTAAIDIAKDAEKLRFKYEHGGRLSDLSSPPSVLQGVHQLLKAASSAMFSKFIEMEKHKNNAWHLQKRLNQASVVIDDKLKQQYDDPQALQLARNLVDVETQLASTRASVTALNSVSADLTARIQQTTFDKQILYAKHQKIQDFNKLSEKKQDLIRVLVKQNMSARSRLRTQQTENIAYTQRMVNSHKSEVEQLSSQLKDAVITEVDAFKRLPLCLLPTVAIASGQKVAVVDLSIHKLDTNMPHVHCGRIITQLLSDLAIPPFIAPELLLPRIVELRTDCNDTAVMLHARRRNNHLKDVEQFAIQLAKLCEDVDQHDQQLTDRLLPVIKQRTLNATQALTDCLEIKDIAIHWWEQPAQLCTPWITVDGMNMKQWLGKWKVITCRWNQLSAASST